MSHHKFELSNNGVGDALRFIQKYFSDCKLSEKTSMQGMLLAEEIMLKLVENGAEGDFLFVDCAKLFGNVKLQIRAKGKKFDIVESVDGTLIELDERADASAQNYIQSLLFKQFEDRIRYRNKGGENSVRIVVKKSENSSLVKIVFSMVISIVLALIMNFCFPSSFNNAFVEYVLQPFRNIFMQALTMLVGPLVFLSISSSIASFGNLATLGRIGAKVMGCYVLTSIIAVFLGFFVCTFFVSAVDGSSLVGMFENTFSSNDPIQFSLKDTIVGIVPSNIVLAFAESNYLQIIFLGVVCGIAANMIGARAKIIQDIFEAFNELFLVIVKILAMLVPFVIAASLMITIFDLGTGAILSIFKYWLILNGTIVSMVAVYGVLVLVFARTSPWPLIKKYFSTTATSVFSLSSSAAAMPINMLFCERRLGVSKKVCSFSIPLGATINMDGTSIVSIMLTLIGAQVYGVDISLGTYVSLFTMTFLFSLACPAVPGAVILVVAALLKTAGVPLEFMPVVLVLIPLLDMTVTVVNTTGDVSTTFIVAKSEGLADMEVYRK